MSQQRIAEVFENLATEITSELVLENQLDLLPQVNPSELPGNQNQQTNTASE